jgi:hypothetical protein
MSTGNPAGTDNWSNGAGGLLDRATGLGLLLYCNGED